MAISDCVQTRIAARVVYHLQQQTELVSLAGTFIQLGSWTTDPEGAGASFGGAQRRINVYPGAFDREKGVSNVKSTSVQVIIELLYPRNIMATEAGCKALTNEAAYIADRLYVGEGSQPVGKLKDPANTAVTIADEITRIDIEEPRVAPNFVLRMMSVTYSTRLSAQGVSQ